MVISILRIMLAEYWCYIQQWLLKSTDNLATLIGYFFIAVGLMFTYK